MKIISIIQVALGFMAAYASFYLATMKRLASRSDGLTIPTPSPSSFIETGLMIMGSIILWLALIQQHKHLRLALLQAICGVLITIISAIMVGQANMSYYYTGTTDFLAFALVPVGLLVSISGIVQIVKSKTSS